ncbi:MAG: hypothetical protein J6S67_03910 [Methanobrevibacter sp.]|nr:hypothetical protein [Methanobrevibacter sp.]
MADLDKQKIKQELFKTILANPSNSIKDLDVNKVINAVDEMFKAIQKIN